MPVSISFRDWYRWFCLGAPAWGTAARAPSFHGVVRQPAYLPTYNSNNIYARAESGNLDLGILLSAFSLSICFPFSVSTSIFLGVRRAVLVLGLVQDQARLSRACLAQCHSFINHGDLVFWQSAPSMRSTCQASQMHCHGHAAFPRIVSRIAFESSTPSTPFIQP